MASVKKFVTNSNPYAKYNKTQQNSPYQLVNTKNEGKPETNLNENHRKNVSGAPDLSQNLPRKTSNRGSFDKKIRENEKSSQDHSTKCTQNTDSTTDKSRLKISIHNPNPPIPMSDYLFIGGERTNRSSASTKFAESLPYFPRVQTSSQVLNYFYIVFIKFLLNS